MFFSTVMCGNRLKLWKTMPTSLAQRVDVDPPPADAVAVEADLAAFDRLECVDAAQQRRLAAARGTDEADDLVQVDVEVDAAQHLVRAERLVHVAELEERHALPPRHASWPAAAGSSRRASG